MDSSLTLGERAADLIAGAGRSWTFILALNGGMLLYMVSQQMLGRQAFDPYPYILLNLFLSWMAANQAPVIMMSQGRLDDLQRKQIAMQSETLRAILVITKSIEERIENEMSARAVELKQLKDS